MKRIATLSALAAIMTLTAAGPAFADHGHHKWKKHKHHQADRAYEQGYRDGRHDAIRYRDRAYTDYYVIEDYHRYNLAPPPHGYYYARVDGDVVMVQLATQLVTQLLIGR